MVKQPDPSDDLPKRLEKDVINELPLVRFQGSIKFAEDSKSFTDSPLNWPSNEF